MKTAFRAGLTFLVILALVGIVSSEIGLNQSIIRRVAVLNVSLAKPVSNVSVVEGGEFLLAGSVACSGAPCGNVYLFPMFCSGKDCGSFTAIGDEQDYDLYVRNGEAPYKCLNLQETIFRYRGITYINNCSSTWVIRVRHVGLYRIILSAFSDKAAFVFSRSFYVRVSGCGDGVCDPNETYSSCPVDCCNRDCTGFSDGVCHSFCNGFNKCVFSSGCDGKHGNSSFCVSPTSFIKCCTNGVTSCGLGNYCLDASCRNCSMVCDGKCESSACFTIDPDCDIGGNAHASCCGNGVLDKGEECDGGLAGTKCDGECSGKCLCPTTTTTTAKSTIDTVAVIKIPTTTAEAATTTYEAVATTVTIASSNETGGGVPAKDSLSDYIIFLIPALLLLFALGLAAFLMYRRSSREKLLKEYWRISENEDLLDRSVQTVRQDYNDRKMNLEDASRMILAYEKDLSSQRQAKEALLRKLGGRVPNMPPGQGYFGSGSMGAKKP